jgi:hypothetical protein
MQPAEALIRYYESNGNTMFRFFLRKERHRVSCEHLGNERACFIS